MMRTPAGPSTSTSRMRRSPVSRCPRWWRGARPSSTSTLPRPKSASRIATRLCRRASATARLTATLVLPTPPLPLVTARVTTCPWAAADRVRGGSCAVSASGGRPRPAGARPAPAAVARARSSGTRWPVPRYETGSCRSRSRPTSGPSASVSSTRVSTTRAGRGGRVGVEQARGVPHGRSQRTAPGGSATSVAATEQLQQFPRLPLAGRAPGRVDQHAGAVRRAECPLELGRRAGHGERRADDVGVQRAAARPRRRGTRRRPPARGARRAGRAPARRSSRWWSSCPTPGGPTNTSAGSERLVAGRQPSSRSATARCAAVRCEACRRRWPSAMARRRRRPSARSRPAALQSRRERRPVEAGGRLAGARGPGVSAGAGSSSAAGRAGWSVFRHRRGSTAAVTSTTRCPSQPRQPSSGTSRVESTSASGPSSARAWASASRTELLRYRLRCMSVEHRHRGDPDVRMAPRCGTARRHAAAPARTGATGAAAALACKEAQAVPRPSRAPARCARPASAPRPDRVARTAPWSVRTSDCSSRSSSDGREADGRQLALLVLVRRGRSRGRARLRTCSVITSVSLVAGGHVRDGLEDGGQVADRHALAQQVAQHALDLADRHQLGNQLLDQLRRELRDAIDHVLGLLPPEQVRQERPDRLRQMRRQGRRRVDDGVAGRRPRDRAARPGSTRRAGRRRVRAWPCRRSRLDAVPGLIARSRSGYSSPRATSTPFTRIV